MQLFCCFRFVFCQHARRARAGLVVVAFWLIVDFNFISLFVVSVVIVVVVVVTLACILYIVCFIFGLSLSITITQRTLPRPAVLT